MSRRKIIIGMLGFLLGLGLVLYPYVSDYLYKIVEARVVGTQRGAVDKAGDEALAEEMRASQEYNEKLLESRAVITDPFDPANQPISTEEYMKRDNIAGDGVMGTLVIPKINALVPLYHGTSDDVLGRGAGHMEATSLPVGGPSTHAAFAGHNGLPSVRIFDDLHKLEKGDYFVIEVLGEDHAYQVTGVETVLPDETDSLKVQEGKDLVTLITCTPYGVNTHRLLVHAERTAVPAEWYEHDKAATDGMPGIRELALPAGLVAAALIMGVTAVKLGAVRRRRAASVQMQAEVRRRVHGAAPLPRSGYVVPVVPGRAVRKSRVQRTEGDVFCPREDSGRRKPGAHWK